MRINQRATAEQLVFKFVALRIKVDRIINVPFVLSLCVIHFSTILLVFGCKNSGFF